MWALQQPFHKNNRLKTFDAQLYEYDPYNNRFTNMWAL